MNSMQILVYKLYCTLNENFGFMFFFQITQTNKQTNKKLNLKDYMLHHIFMG